MYNLISLNTIFSGVQVPSCSQNQSKKKTNLSTQILESTNSSKKLEFISLTLFFQG